MNVVQTYIYVYIHFIFVYLKIIFLKFDLQIGAGTSLPGITAVKCGANVILSDSSDYPQCLENCRISCEANELSNIPVIGIKWGQFNSNILNLQPVDIILGSDCFFDTQGRVLVELKVGNFDLCKKCCILFINFLFEN